MKTKEMIELVQQHHPHMGEQEIIKLLNRAKDSFCEETEIYKKTYQFTTASSQRWYALPEGILKIESVYLNDVLIPKLQGNPKINDES